MKDYKRLGVGIRGRNDPSNQTIVLQVEDFDGGEFELYPKLGEQSLILVDPTRPSGYAYTIVGTSGALSRLANALNALARKVDDDGNPTDGDADSTNSAYL